MNAVIIAASGKGSRVGAEINKLFLPVAGKIVLAYTLEKFLALAEVDDIIVTLSADDMEMQKDHIRQLSGDPRIRWIEGGETRALSIRNGIHALRPETTKVLVHDGARPYVDSQDILHVLEALDEAPVCALVQAVRDTVKHRQPEDLKVTTIPREEVFLALTPQGLQADIAREIYAQAEETLQMATDDCALAELAGYTPQLLVSEKKNTKITLRKDLRQFEQSLLSSGILRTGIGYDIHAYAEERRLILGGVEIPAEYGLLGHSDADVPIHALMDALLASAGLRDIGVYFPNTDEKWKDASSLHMLAKVREILLEKGFLIGNVTVMMVAEKPKLSPYIEEMRENISRTLQLAKDRIAVQVTTNEGMGALGRGEGIAALANVTIIERMNHHAE